MSGATGHRKKIVWDLDDTLVETTRAWLAWESRRSSAHPALPRFEDLNENPPHILCRMERSAFLASLDAFRATSEALELAPCGPVLRWFEKHGDSFEHHVLTARPRCAVGYGASWVFRHLSRWVRHFHFVPAKRPGDDAPDSGASKRHVFREIGPSACFLDDSETNLTDCSGLASRLLLVPQPWNSQRLSLEEVLSQIE